MNRISGGLRGTLALMLTLFLGSVATRGATFRAGVARTDITPPPGVRLWGYSDRKSPATSTLDPRYTRVP